MSCARLVFCVVFVRCYCLLQTVCDPRRCVKRNNNLTVGISANIASV